MKTSFENISRFEKKTSFPASVALIFVSFLVIAFFTYDTYYSFLEKKDTLSSLQAEENAKKTTLESLNILRETAHSGTSAPDIERYASIYREDAILANLAEVSGSWVMLGNISLDKGVKLPSGLSLANISISTTASSLEEFKKLIDRLVDPSAKRRYLVKSVSIPLDFGTPLPIVTTIQLGLYYLK